MFSTILHFSGMEVASYLIDKALSITVIGSSEMPYQNTLGPEIGKVTMMVRNRERAPSCVLTVQLVVVQTLLFLQMLSEKNVRFYMNDNVTEVRGVDGKVKLDDARYTCFTAQNSEYIHINISSGSLSFLPQGEGGYA